PPVAIGVADQQEPRLAVRSAAEYDPARRGLPLGAALFALHPIPPPLTQCGMRNAECGIAGLGRSHVPATLLDVRALDSAFRIPHSALHSFRIVSEYTEGEVLPRVRLDVRQKLPQLDHREGGLAVQGRVRHQQAERPAAVRDA